MRIAVLVKAVPDTWSERSLDLETGLAERSEEALVLDEIGERALELALRVQEAGGEGDHEVVVVTMGPESAGRSLRRALAMGGDRAVHIVDEALLGADLSLTAEVLASALRTVDADLVLTGDRSTDGAAGVLPIMLSELLGLPAVTGATEVLVEAGVVRAVCDGDGARATVEAELPAVVSVTEAMPEGRVPSLRGTLAAKKKEVDLLDLAGLGIAIDDDRDSRSIMIAISRRPPRAAGRMIDDDGTAGAQLAAFLAENGLVP